MEETQEALLPEKERERLENLIRTGKIEYDSYFYVFTIDGIHQAMRGDMLPHFCGSMKLFLKDI